MERDLSPYGLHALRTLNRLQGPPLSQRNLHKIIFTSGAHCFADSEIIVSLDIKYITHKHLSTSFVNRVERSLPSTDPDIGAPIFPKRLANFAGCEMLESLWGFP